MPLSSLYNLIVKARARMFASGIIRSHDLGIPVISIGNITVGGTGKTPLVAYVAKVLAEHGRNVCILTRGYKRENPSERVVVSLLGHILATVKQAGDEPYDLAQKLIFIPCSVIADKDRAAAGEWAKEHAKSDAFVLDDGFQHLKLKRDLDLVTIDAMNPFGNGKLLPQGILRESSQSLNRADAIILTRVNLSENVDGIKNRIQQAAPDVPVFLSYNKTTIGSLTYAKQKAVAFCALGNPANFFDQLRAEGYDISGTRAFPDHHSYTQTDVSELETLAKQSHAEIFLTTSKDAVKLIDLEFSIPWRNVEIELVFDDEKGLRDLITQALYSKKQ